MNADGTGQTRLTTDPGDDEQPVWSPNGTKIAFVSAREGSRGIWVMNADGSVQTKLAWGGGVDDPAWSPDGSKIAFSSWSDVSVINADGTGVVTNLTNVGPSLWALEPAWSPDGARIAYRCCDDDNWEIYVMNADGTSPTNLSNNPSWDTDQAWSPDGTQIAFSSDRDGNAEIYVVKPDGTSLTRVTNTSGDHEYDASWAPGSSRLAVECTIGTNVEVCVVDANGVTNVSNHPWVDMDPAWSP
jgi:Tol biopolymer transport system component